MEDGIFVDIRVGGRAEKEKGVNKRCDAVKVDLWRSTLEEEEDDDSSHEAWTDGWWRGQVEQ